MRSRRGAVARSVASAALRQSSAHSTQHADSSVFPSVPAARLAVRLHSPHSLSPRGRCVCARLCAIQRIHAQHTAQHTRIQTLDARSRTHHTHPHQHAPISTHARSHARAPPPSPPPPHSLSHSLTHSHYRKRGQIEEVRSGGRQRGRCSRRVRRERPHRGATAAPAPAAPRHSPLYLALPARLMTCARAFVMKCSC
jgi:hypothetical protein